ncbi:Hypothetical predicted protein [Paramuricea clavata]|uniref:Uncharacterized protein n=1 Tax=Paramuricea clavata TaxID=317549 RepID=A0A6S7I5R4_PARCT|nr:Hypothetical predicted protein [Paramuricea clavata]
MKVTLKLCNSSSPTPNCHHFKLSKSSTLSNEYGRSACTSDPNLMPEYKDVFGEIGCLQGEYHIITDPEVKPVIHPPRIIPISMMDKLKAELERMKQLDVIDTIDGPTDWVSSLVIVEKPNGQIRLCLDPRDLNKAIKRHHHPMPTVDEILAKLEGAKVFSKFDASSGY